MSGVQNRAKDRPNSTTPAAVTTVATSKPRVTSGCVIAIGATIAMASRSRNVAVAAAGFCAFLNLYSPQALLPTLAREFAVGAAEISSIMTASTLAIAVTAPFTVPDPAPLPQSVPVPESAPVALTCRHCAPDPVTGSVTVPLATVKFPFTVTGTLNVFAAPVSRSRKFVPLGIALI